MRVHKNNSDLVYIHRGPMGDERFIRNVVSPMTAELDI